MTHDPIDDDIEALLRRERNRPDEPAERIAEIRANAEAKIVALGLGTEGSGSSSAGDGGSGAVGGGTPTALGSASTVSSSAHRLAGASTSPRLAGWLVRAGIFATGATSGWIAHTAVDAHRDSAETSHTGAHVGPSGAADTAERGSAPHPSHTAPTGLAGVADDASTPTPSTTSPAQRVRESNHEEHRLTAASATATGGGDSADGSAPSAHGEGTALAEERRLLESARGELTRGQPMRALDWLAQHRERFPSGRLSEERDALEIRALAAEGRSGAARALADAFRTRYPRSVLRPVVDRAVAPEPTMPAASSPSPGPAAADSE